MGEAAKPSARPRQKVSESNKAGRSQATILIELVSGAEYFHSPGGRLFVTVAINGHLETHSLTSKSFGIYLRRRYFEAKRSALSSKGLKDAVGFLEAKALYEGPELEVFCRLGHHEDCFYIDCCDEQWSVIEISREGWRVIPNALVKFRRTLGMMPLPHPVSDEQGEEHFRRCINHQTDGDLALIKAFILAAMRPKGPYPILTLYGRHGSAKSTTAKALRLLVDPNKAPVRAQPKDERDLAIAANSSWIQSFDNVSSLPIWLSDALCGISTGRGFATRELRTDEDEILFDSCRPSILNGIDNISTRPDLMDRALVVELPPIKIKESERMPEKTFWRNFNKWRPGMIAYFLDALTGAMGNIAHVTLPGLPRMADFAEWSVAAEVPLGLGEGGFMRAYDSNRGEANTAALDSSPIATHIRKLIAGLTDGSVRPYRSKNWVSPTWTGTASELFEEIIRLATEQEKKSKGWPKNAQSLSRALRQIAPNLSAIGIEIVFERENDNPSIRLTKTEAFKSTAASQAHG